MSMSTKETLPEFETLETRGRDRLDFRDVHVGSVRGAIEAAYQAGRSEQTAKQDTP